MPDAAMRPPAARSRLASLIATELLTLSTPLEVKIFDPSIGIVLILMRILVVVYVATRACLYWTIIDYEGVNVAFNWWSFSALPLQPPEQLPPMCAGAPEYSFIPENILQTGGAAYWNFSCPSLMSGAEVFRSVGSEAQIITSIQRHYKQNCGGVMSFGLLQQEPGGLAYYSNSSCVSSEFVYGVEDLPLFLVHYVQAPALGIHRKNMECKILAPNDAAALYTHTNETLTGNGWRTSIRELLIFAGVDPVSGIDSLNEGSAIHTLVGKPSYRITGAIVTLRFRFKNYQAFEGGLDGKWTGSEPFCQLQVSVASQAWGYIGTSSEYREDGGEQVVLRNAIRLRMIYEGEFGAFSYRQLISAVVEGVVLLGIASSLTTILAGWLYGEKFTAVTEKQVMMRRAMEDEGGKEGESQQENTLEGGQGNLAAESMEAATTGLGGGELQEEEDFEGVFSKPVTKRVESAMIGATNTVPSDTQPQGQHSILPRSL